MPYIVKSSVEVGSTIIPWNEQESNRLMQEKKEYLEKKEAEKVVVEPEIKENKKFLKNNKKSQKAGEK